MLLRLVDWLFHPWKFQEFSTKCFLFKIWGRNVASISFLLVAHLCSLSMGFLPGLKLCQWLINVLFHIWSKLKQWRGFEISGVDIVLLKRLGQRMRHKKNPRSVFMSRLRTYKWTHGQRVFPPILEFIRVHSCAWFSLLDNMWIEFGNILGATRLVIPTCLYLKHLLQLESFRWTHQKQYANDKSWPSKISLL